MVKCFVVCCKSRYDSCKEKISMFKVPRDLLDNWRRAIPKRDIKLGSNSYICSKPFKNDKILWFWTSGTGESQISVPLKRPKLMKGEIPSIFPGCPLSCEPKIFKKRKSPKKRDIEISTKRCVSTLTNFQISECEPSVTKSVKKGEKKRYQ